MMETQTPANATAIIYDVNSNKANCNNLKSSHLEFGGNAELTIQLVNLY